MEKAFVTVLGMWCLVHAAVHSAPLSHTSPVLPSYQPSKPVLEMTKSPLTMLEIESSYIQNDSDDIDESGDLSVADAAALSFRSVPANAWAELPSFLQLSTSTLRPMTAFLLVSSYSDSQRRTGQVWAIPLQSDFPPYVLIQNLTQPAEMCYSSAQRVLYVWELGEGRQAKVLHFEIEMQEQGRILSKALGSKGWEQDCRLDEKAKFDTKNEQMAAICGSIVPNTPQKGNLTFVLACDGTDLYLANSPTGQIYSLSQTTGELKPIATIAFPRAIVVLSTAERTLPLLILAWL